MLEILKAILERLKCILHARKMQNALYTEVRGMPLSESPLLLRSVCMTFKAQFSFPLFTEASVSCLGHLYPCPLLDSY